MVEVARYAFASLALSAKLHKMLDEMGVKHGLESDLTFDHELESALDRLEVKHPSLREDTRSLEIELLKRDFLALEELYESYKRAEGADLSAVERLDSVFESIREKMKEKELMI